MRKVLAAVVCAAILTLCACGNKAESSPEISAPQADDGRENPISEDDFETVEAPGGVRITKYTGTSIDVKIPDVIGGKKVVSLRNMDFGGLHSQVESVHIPAGVTELNSDRTLYVFSERFREFTVDENNPEFYSEDGVLYGKDNVLLMYPCAKEGDSFEIPDGIAAIGEYAFNNAVKLKSVAVPESVTELREGAFNNCENLDEVNIPESITELSAYVFGGCGRLSKLVIPGRVTEISGLAFAYSDWADENADENGLVVVNGILIDASNAEGDITLPETVRRIADYAFDRDPGPVSVVVPASVTEIGEMAFIGCEALRRVTLPDAPDFDVEDLFYGMEGLTVEYRGETITIKE